MKNMVEKLPIVKEPHNILRNSVKELSLKEITGKKIQKLLSDMKSTLAATPDGVGLAAPQVGEGLAIFIVSEEAEEIDKVKNQRWEEKREEWKQTKNKPYEEREWKYYVFINPAVKKFSKKRISGPEGCLSVPGKFGLVKRYEKITVEAYDEQGKRFTRGASKFLARVLQHELDHLNGTLFVDKAEQVSEGVKYD